MSKEVKSPQNNSEESRFSESFLIFSLEGLSLRESSRPNK